jgi:phosphoglucosamine mutase
MTRKYFGTDGIRGTANKGSVTPYTVLRLALATGELFRRGDHRHRVVIGKDTRLSGYMLEPALTSGFTAMGMDVMLVGPMPTPAVAMLTRSLRADVGVMISASHNPYQDNGLKLFGPDGYKLSDVQEEEIESLMDVEGLELAEGKALGRATRLEDAPGRYIEFVKQTFPKRLRLDGLKIVIDCANGAAYRVAPTVFHELGADVVPVATQPDGTNINRDCGATSPEAMSQQVVTHGADLGIALDGDADRLIISDEHGDILNGDHVMALIASSWQKTGRLRGGSVVATVMSNLGFERFLDGLGLDLVRTAVGDRNVVDYMRTHNHNVGGEQSGHIILNDFSTTGDGLIAALQVLAAVIDQDRPVSEVCRLFEPLPQVLRNVRFSAGKPLDVPAVREAIFDGEARMAKTGRVLIRPSGTEPLIRVMVEGNDGDLVDEVVGNIAEAIERVAQS